jgi:hypothetical protein
MRTIRAIAALACMGACSFAATAAFSGCDERYPASCKTKPASRAAAAAAPAQDASSAKRTERRRSARSERKARYKSARRARTKYVRLSKRRAQSTETEIAAPQPLEAPHRSLKIRAFDESGDLSSSGLLTPVRFGGPETASFITPVRPVFSPELEAQAARPIAAIAASHLLAASTSTNAAEILGITSARAATHEEVRQSTSLFTGWTDSGIMRMLFITIAGLLMFGTAVRLAL